MWNPGIDLALDRSIFRVTAADVEAFEDPENCDLQAALKVRTATFPDTGQWRLRKSPIFPLRELLDAIESAHRAEAGGASLSEAVSQAKRHFSGLHRGQAAYLAHALESYMDYHEARVEQLGPLTYRGVWNELFIDERQTASLLAWAPMYEAANGDREVRRLRMGEARQTTTIWRDLAAYVAAHVDPAVGVERNVFVVEIGLIDGVERHLAAPSISHEAAASRYESSVRPVVRAIPMGVARRPGRDCAQCKYLGGCPDLTQVPGMLQLARKADFTRSVSAADLSLYEQCPSRWYMQRALHLPREDESSEDQLRGLAVHRWLAGAHERAEACTDAMLDGGERFGLEPEEFNAALPFLRRHVEVCPFANTSSIEVSREETLYAFDSQADVVVVSKPDMTWVNDDTLVFREVKSTKAHLPADADEARDRHLSTSINLLLAVSGVAASRGASVAEVQLEILTPSAAATYTYRTDDAILMKLAAGRVRRLAEDWARDRSWQTRPGASCSHCPVRRWCPDRDVFASRASTSEDGSTTDIPF